MLMYTCIYKVSPVDVDVYMYIYITSWDSLLIILNVLNRCWDIYIYVWKLNQTVLELDFRAVKFLFFPRRDLNSHHWYTAAQFA